MVVGLGRFGLSVARTLEQMDREVLAVDRDTATVQRRSDEFTHVVAADATDSEALRQIGAEQFDVAVVGIGSDVESSVMTVVTLAEIGIPQIWAKAITRKHGRILSAVGAHHVVYPETAMGERVAHMAADAVMDYIELDDDYVIARTPAPEATWNRSVAQADLGSTHQVTVVAVKTAGAEIGAAQPETTIHRGDQLIVAGEREHVERFCTLS